MFHTQTPARRDSMRRPRGRAARLAAAAALTLGLTSLAACGSDSTTQAHTPDYVGTYNLVTLGGAALPTTVTTGTGEQVEFVSGTLVLSASGAYQAAFETHQPPTDTQVKQAGSSGTYTVSGTTLTLQKGGAQPATITGTVSNGQVTFTDPLVPDDPFVFQK